MPQPFTLFEVSWEVCNKVGGIHTVVSSKAKTLTARMGDDYIAVGPWLLSDPSRDIPFDEEPAWGDFCESCRVLGVPVRMGRWRIPGRPLTMLVGFSQFYDQKDAILSKLWEDYSVDSISGGWDYVEPILFGHAVGRVIEQWWLEHLAPEHRRAAVHVHEWMTGSALLYLKSRVPAIATVFMTHATMLGRALASVGRSPADGLQGQNAKDLASAHGVSAKHSMEGVTARQADAFTTVSEITAKEASLFHERGPEPITPNGLDLEVVDALAGSMPRQEVRAALVELASRFFGEDVADAAFLAISGRYEFHNKGIDLLLDAVAKLGERPGRRLVLLLLCPAGNSGVKSQFLARRSQPVGSLDGSLGLTTHNLFDAERDPIYQHCAKLGLDNRPGARVRVLHVPTYLGKGDGFLELAYETVLRGVDLTSFPSFYEPWGYTPQESLALGVPTTTTDHAGFGRWAQGLGLGAEHGVVVLARAGVPDAQARDNLAQEIEHFLANEHDPEELARACRATAARTGWADFIAYYDKAYALALAAAEARLGSGVPSVRRPRLALTVQPTKEAQRPHLHKFEVAATLPRGLEGLARLARNYWWSWDPEGSSLFEELSPTSWRACGHNPLLFLQRAYREDLDERAADPDYRARLERVLARFDDYLAQPVDEGRWRASVFAAEAPSRKHPVAYFCAEFGVHESLRTYSGGLGALAGDHLKSASDLNLPLVAVGLFYRMGYFTQRLGPAGEQVEVDLENDPRKLPVEPVLGPGGVPLEITLNLPGRPLHLRAWRVQVGRVELYLLDSNIASNRAEDRDITRNLYGGEQEVRLQQEIVLGRGGVHLLRALGVEPAVFHMNEGHAAFLTLERVGHLTLKEGLTFDEARDLVRATTLFTTHTPVPAGHDRFGEDLMRRYFSDVADWVGVPWERFFALGQAEGDRGAFNMTYLAMNFASFTNGVSQLHGEVSRKLFRTYWPGLLEGELPVDAVTNGIHLPTWTHPSIASVLGIRTRSVVPEDFDRALSIEELPQLWRAKQELKRRLLEEVRLRLKRGFLDRGDKPEILTRTLDGLEEDALLIGFARRFAPYKRAALVFKDPARLEALLSDSTRPVRILVAGKAHPRDGLGRDVLKSIVERARRSEFLGRVLFLEDYDLELARLMVQGVDLWLNSPIRLQEASGTSGMKAAANGTLHISIDDGWWPEAYDGENGWLIGEPRHYKDPELQDQLDASMLYRLLEEEVVPLYFERDASGLPNGWLTRMRRCLATIPLHFNTDRMVLDYAAKAYGPLSKAGIELARDRKARLRTLVQERTRIRKGFEKIKIVSAHVGELAGIKVGNTVEVRVEVDLDGLSPEDVLVELVVGHTRDESEMVHLAVVPLAPVQKVGEAVHAFEGVRVMDRSGSFSYGIRVRARAGRETAEALFDLVLWA
jgi:phosphorylase/glycogen(starch) synthase